MKNKQQTKLLIVGAFSLIYTYILSFVFEGHVLFSLLNHVGIAPNHLTWLSIMAHFLGLLVCPYLVRTALGLRRVVLIGFFLCLVTSLPFFFPAASLLWTLCLITAGFASGCIVTVWACYLKTFFQKEERTQTCADLIILTNLLMIGVNLISRRVSAVLGLSLALICLVVGMVALMRIPMGNVVGQAEKAELRVFPKQKRVLIALFFFIAVITVNSGLMYQVINPAFQKLPIADWYWALPYVIALLIMRNLPHKVNSTPTLYLGIGMIMASFICFAALGRSVWDYLVVNTLMLGACGIFDLFWWSIMGGAGG